MSAFFERPWLLWPLLISLGSAIVFGAAAWALERRKTRPRKVRAKGYTGAVRDTAKLALVGSGAGWVTALLSKDLDQYPFIRQLLAATLIVSLLAAIVNLHLSASVDTKLSADGKSVDIDSTVLPVEHGCVLGLSLSAAAFILFAVVAIAISI